MNAAYRKALAARIADIAKANGAVVELHEDNGLRTYPGWHIDATFPDVRVSIDVDNLHKGGVMAHWHRATRPLATGVFDSVNECHRAKATQYRPNGDAFCDAFAAACAAVQVGTAFDDSWKYVPLRRG